MSKFDDMIRGLQDTEVPQNVRTRTRETFSKLPDKQEKQVVRDKFWMKYAATAAAVMIVGTGFCYTNPILAAKIPFIGKIFTEVQQIVTFSGTFDDKAEVLNTEGSSEVEIQNPMYIAESDGITITASEVYCDGLSIFLTAEVNMEQGGLDNIAGNLLYLDGSWKIAGDKEEKMMVNNNLEGKVIDDHTFVGMLKLDLDKADVQNGVCDLQLSMIGYDDLDELDAEDISASHKYSAEWNLSVPFTVDTEAAKTIEINKESNGYCLRKIFVSPYQVIAYTDVPYTECEITKEDYAEAVKEKTGSVSGDIGLTYEEYVEEMGKSYATSCTLIYNQNGEMVTPREDIRGRSVYAVQGMDISKLYIYVFDDLDAFGEVYENGMDCDAVNQAVLFAEVDVN